MRSRTILTLLSILLLLSPAFAQKIKPAAATAKVVDLPNFAAVAPNIYRGAAPTEGGLRQLQARGIHTVIDLRISPKQVAKEKAFAESLGLTWLNIPMGSDPPTSRQVATFLSTLKRAPTEPVFVHCQHGADRTGCMIGIWRVTQQGWSYPQTYKEMRHYGFKPFLKKMAKSVEQKAKNG